MSLTSARSHQGVATDEPLSGGASLLDLLSLTAFTFPKTEVTDAGQMEELFARHRLDAAVHLASIAPSRGEAREALPSAPRRAGKAHVARADRRILFEHEVSFRGTEGQPPRRSPGRAKTDPRRALLGREPPGRARMCRATDRMRGFRGS